MTTSVEKIPGLAETPRDLESVRDAQISVKNVLLSLYQNPFQIFKRWNWKSALVGAVMRATFYFTVYKLSRESWLVTLSAVSVELIFRVCTAGVSGALIQSFRRAEPAWAAMLVVAVTLPVFGHTVEFTSHYIHETYFSNIFPPSVHGSRLRAFAFSVGFSVLSALFNCFMMRRGTLLVGAGDETKSLWGDIKDFPLAAYDFVLFLPRKVFSPNKELP